MKNSIPSKNELKDIISHLVLQEIGDEKSNNSIDSKASLHALGVSSIGSLAIIGELETQLGLTLPETLLWECENIEQIVDNLHENYDSYKTNKS